MGWGLVVRARMGVWGMEELWRGRGRRMRVGTLRSYRIPMAPAFPGIRLAVGRMMGYTVIRVFVRAYLKRFLALLAYKVHIDVNAQEA